MPKLFVGVALPDEVRAELARVAAVLEPQVQGARWVRAEGYHLTLAFLGPVADERVAEVAGAVGRAAEGSAAARTALTEVGAFPSMRRARVVWVGLDDMAGVIASIAAGTQRALQPHGFEPEARPYHPHVTLARIAQPRRLDPVVVAATPFSIAEVTLFESRLRRDGARYEALASFPLRP